MKQDLHIIERNKRLAEFQGLKKCITTNFQGSRCEGFIKDTMEWPTDSLRYHESLDWLYPVWQKFYNLKFARTGQQVQHDLAKDQIQTRFREARSIEEIHDVIFCEIRNLKDY